MTGDERDLDEGDEGRGGRPKEGGGPIGDPGPLILLLWFANLFGIEMAGREGSGPDGGPIGGVFREEDVSVDLLEVMELKVLVEAVRLCSGLED